MGMHTPGQLVISEKSYQCRYQIEDSRGLCLIALDDRRGFDNHANACLIAAAPEILKELRAHVEFFSGTYINTGEEFQTLRAAALAAIELATGATP